MGERFRVGELVVRRSHKEDMVFKVEALSHNVAVLRSVETRLMADAPLEDLVPVAGAPRRIPASEHYHACRGLEA